MFACNPFYLDSLWALIYFCSIESDCTKCLWNKHLDLLFISLQWYKISRVFFKSSARRKIFPKGIIFCWQQPLECPSVNSWQIYGVAFFRSEWGHQIKTAPWQALIDGHLNRTSTFAWCCAANFVKLSLCTCIHDHWLIRVDWCPREKFKLRRLEVLLII